MFMLIFTAAPLFCTLLHILRLKKKERTFLRLLSALIRYLLIINVGLGGLFAFSGHLFAPDVVAHSIGWPTGSPFQTEVAYANLAFGVLGLLCVRFKGDFWLATGIGYAVFMLGAAAVHLKDIAMHGNLSGGNAGAVLWVGDILMPLLLCGLLLLQRSMLKEHSR